MGVKRYYRLIDLQGGLELEKGRHGVPDVGLKVGGGEGSRGVWGGGAGAGSGGGGGRQGQELEEGRSGAGDYFDLAHPKPVYQPVRRFDNRFLRFKTDLKVGRFKELNWIKIMTDRIFKILNFIVI